MTDAERIRAEREAQGLDPTVTDAAALARVAAIVALDRKLAEARA